MHYRVKCEVMRQDNDLRTAANTIEWLIETRIKVLQYPVKVKRGRKKAVQKQTPTNLNELKQRCKEDKTEFSVGDW